MVAESIVQVEKYPLSAGRNTPVSYIYVMRTEDGPWMSMAIYLSFHIGFLFCPMCDELLHVKIGNLRYADIFPGHLDDRSTLQFLAYSIDEHGGPSNDRSYQVLRSHNLLVNILENLRTYMESLRTQHGNLS